MSADGQLRWRCRRGMRELDALLQRFADAALASLDERERRCFAAILELPDPVLHDYLVGGNVHSDTEIARLVERIRGTAGPST